MDRQAQLERLLDHYDKPRNYGPLVDSLRVEGGQPDCGDEVTIYLQPTADGQHAAAIQFEGRGCTISQAAASIISEELRGAPFARILAFADQELLDLLGREVVQARPRCATLALHTLQTAVLKWQRGHQPDETREP